MLTLTALVTVVTLAADRPRVVLLIRHAEKPPMGDPDVGLTETGRRRAAALPKLFKVTADRPDPFPTPDFVFAAKNTDRSHRSVRTVKPLVVALGLTVQADILNEDYPKLVEELARPKYAGKVVLVAWHHGNLPELAHRLGAADAPNKWAEEVFDRVWQIGYTADGAITFCSKPQRLLPGDK